MKKRIIARLLVVAGLVIGGVFTLGVTAAEAVGPCGSGYTQIDSYNMYANGSSGTVRGHLLLYWNGTRNCSVAECYTNCGQTLWRITCINDGQGIGWDDCDSGNFTTYAGPAYSDPSAGECVDLHGLFSTQPDGGTIVAKRTVHNVHCG